MLITVSKNGNEGYSSLQEALDSIPKGHPSEVTIRIKPGIYEGKITVGKESPPILLLGEDPHSTVITWSDNAHTLGPDGEPLGTFRSGTLNVFAEGFTAENLTIRNASGPGGSSGGGFRRCRAGGVPAGASAGRSGYALYRTGQTIL